MGFWLCHRQRRVYLHWALANGVRSATAVTLDGDRDFLQANGIQNLTVMVAAIKLIAWNTAALLMVREHARKAA
ncbi:MAG: hypothetical protein Q7J29_01830 [Stagnimonas sp.]|nr:hypothetical protein [Stagnimonas sp.]